jgi:hypothetical protein
LSIFSICFINKSAKFSFSPLYIPISIFDV